MRSVGHDLLADARRYRVDALVRFARIDVREVVSGVCHSHERVCPTHQLAGAAVLPEHPVWVDGDPVRLQETLRNLISNAIRRMPAAGRIAVHVTPEEDHVIVAVRDSGSGLERREIRSICRAFVEDEGGTEDGLGVELAVAWAVAQAHGGTIDVRSEGRGKGSEVRLILPAST